MNFRFGIRYRVALTFFMLGLIISLAMGSTLYWLTINMEEELVAETLSTELEDYMRRYDTDSKTLAPSSAHIQGYIITGDRPDTTPLELQDLPLGLSHIIMDGSGYYVESRMHNNTHFLMLYADEMIKHRETRYLGFLALGIGLMTLLSSALGLWLAGRVISPITRLAHQVSAMGPDYKLQLPNESPPQDEVGELAQAIDGYHQRLADFNKRERDFTSNVSHELRTPLAVIEGASEVMLANNDLSSDNRNRVERIARAATQITHLTTALLVLAREESDNDSDHRDSSVRSSVRRSVDSSVAKILRQVVKEHQYLLSHKPVDVELVADNDLVISCDPTLLYVVLANIVRNAFSYTHQGVVHIRLLGKRVVVEDTGTGMREEQRLKMFERYYSGNKSSGGYGIGLSLVRRICERYDWKISVHSHEERGTSVELRLS